MKALISHIRNFDWILLTGVFLLVGIGLLSLYSFSVGREDYSFLIKQICFLLVGVVLLITVSLFDWRIIRNNSAFLLTLYIGGIVALMGLFFFAPEIRGTVGWYRIGGISVDPIEYVKVVMLLLMAKYFSARHIEMYRIRHIFISGLYFGMPIFLIFMQPDLGSAALLAILWIVTLLVAGIRIRHLFSLLALGILMFALGWTFFLHDYQKGRILSFLEPELDPLGIGWSQLQSKIAIGNGGLFGQGFGEGTQVQYGFLSEPHTDFIFAAIGEEFGMLGLLILFTIFGLVLWRIVRIGFQGGNNFSRLFGVGFAALLLIQGAVNIGMNLGLLPIVGLPLPFVSYGGSSLIMTFVGLGILQSIKTH